MRIAILEIRNFRGIRHGLIRFKQHSVLIGANNTGKTTVIEALTLLFGRERMVRELTEHDFYGSDPQPEDRIKLVATVTGFASQDPSDHLDWFRDGRGIPKWIDEATGIVTAVQTAQANTLCCQIGAQAYFDQDSLTVEMVRYFLDHNNPIDPFADDMPVGVPPKLIKEIGFYLVRASRILQITVDDREDGRRQLMLLQQVPEVHDRGVFRYRRAQCQMRELTHGRDFLERFFHGRIAEGEPVLQQVNAQHGFQWVRFSTATSLGVERLDQAEQTCPGHDLIHLGKEAFAAGLLALAGVLEVGKAHLAHGRPGSGGQAIFA